MKRLVLMFGILVSSVLGEPTYDLTSGEGNELYKDCVKNHNQQEQACKILISKANLEQDAKKCPYTVDDPDELELKGQVIAVTVFKNRTCKRLGVIFFYAKEYHISKAFFERLCQAGGRFSCFMEGLHYTFGSGVKQDYLKARELYKKSCDMKLGEGCSVLSALYHDGLGVRQNLSIAKQYAGKACDLGEQQGCDLYRELNEKGVQ